MVGHCMHIIDAPAVLLAICLNSDPSWLMLRAAKYMEYHIQRKWNCSVKYDFLELFNRRCLWSTTSWEMQPTCGLGDIEVRWHSIIGHCVTIIFNPYMACGKEAKHVFLVCLLGRQLITAYVRVLSPSIRAIYDSQGDWNGDGYSSLINGNFTNASTRLVNWMGKGKKEKYHYSDITITEFSVKKLPRFHTVEMEYECLAKLFPDGLWMK